MCKDKDGNERPCKVEWSTADDLDPNVKAKTLEVAQQIADKADVDLTLSDGLRPGNDCASSLHQCGLAVDISKINGVDVGTGQTANRDALPLVQRVQEAARSNSGVRENFGPAGLWKAPAGGGAQSPFSNDALEKKHKNHVHIGIFK